MGPRQRIVPGMCGPVHLQQREDTWRVLQWARANDCPWDKWTCAWAAQGGHLEVLQWARANDCPNEDTCTYAWRTLGGSSMGSRQRLSLDEDMHMPPREDTWKSFNGLAPTAVPGMRTPVHMQQREDTWKSFNGPEPTAVPGMSTPVHMQHRGGHSEILQWARANGCPWNEWTPVHMQHLRGHMKFFNGPVPTAVPGISGPVHMQHREDTWKSFNGPAPMAVLE